MAAAAIPFLPSFTLFGYEVHPIVADINIGILYILGIIIIVIFAGFFILRNGENSNKEIVGNVAVANEGEIQKVVIGMKNYNYYPNTIKVKVNQPVSMSLDKTVSGCLRDFTIREFGIRKYLKTPEDTVEFTPNKKGTYTFACSMGMGIGTLIVE